MIVRLYRTVNVDCDLDSVARFVNHLQFFFVVHVVPDALPLPQHFQGFSINAAELARWLQDACQESPEDCCVLLTSSRLNLPSTQSLYHAQRRIAILTNHYWLSSPTASTVPVAKHVIQAGMTSLGSHTSMVDSCVCRAGEGFDCICTDCERYLASLDYRDAIARLKEAFNLFNQIRWVPSARLPEIPLPSNLRLATQYATEISANEREKGRPSPFGDVVILVVLHFLSDLIPFVDALHSLGGRYQDFYMVAKPYPYARRDEVSHRLAALGVNIMRASKGNSVEQCSQRILSLVLQRFKKDGERGILVIEDGGYFAPLLHQPPFASLLKLCRGIVEQTQKGANDDREKIGKENIRVPILSVVECEFKKVYESPAIGRVAIQNIARFTPNIKLSGEHAVIFGFGSVGQEVAFHLNNTFNMTVSVVENRDMAILQARHRKSIVAEVERNFTDLRFGAGALLIVGTTGRKSIVESVLVKLRDGAILVSTSSDRQEIEMDVLERLANGRFHEIELGKQEYTIDSEGGGTKKITVLAEGYPINFYGSESLPNDTIDPVMTLLLLCGAEIVLQHRIGQAFAPGIKTDEVERIVKDRGLVRRFLEASSSRFTSKL
jgi:S-adenosylhomocysteine hydrolase